MSYLKKAWIEFIKDESGMGTLEMILIIIVLISIVLIFKSQITTLVNNVWSSINKDAKKIY